jgi:hypothetical protein
VATMEPDSAKRGASLTYQCTSVDLYFRPLGNQVYADTYFSKTICIRTVHKAAIYGRAFSVLSCGGTVVNLTPSGTLLSCKVVLPVFPWPSAIRGSHTARLTTDSRRQSNRA